MQSFKQGFTFVELIVSISIIAILGTIGIISFSSYGETVRDTSRVSNIQDINVHLREYKLKSKLPEPSQGIEILKDGKTIAKQGELSQLVLNTIGYQKELKDPDTDNLYTYTRSANKKYFQVMALLENAENIPKKAEIEYANSTIQAEKFPYSLGDKLGILTNEENIPIEKQYSQSQLDLDTLQEPLVAYLENNHFTYGTGSILNSLEETNKKGGKFCKVDIYGEITCGALADNRPKGTGLEAIEWKQAIWYNDLPTNIQDIFDKDLPYVKHWKDNNCIKENIQVVNINTSNFNDLCRLDWAGNCQKHVIQDNKIYVFEEGTYNFIDGFETENQGVEKACNAVIGEPGKTIFKTQSTNGYVFDGRTRGHILYGFIVDGGSPSRGVGGIKLSEINITMMNVEIKNTDWGIQATTSNGLSGYILGKNMRIHSNNNGFEIHQVDNTIFSNVDVYNNEIGMHLRDTNTSISNVNIFNNDYGLKFNGGDGVMNNANIFNNDYGTYISGQQGGLIFNNVNFYGNEMASYLGSNRGFIGNNLVYHNNRRGMYNYNGTVTYYGRLVFFNNSIRDYYNKKNNGYIHQGIGSYLFSNGVQQNTDKVGKAIPNMTGWTDSIIGQGSFGELQGFTFEQHLPMQSRPLKNDSTSPSYYGEDRGNMYDYISDYYIGQWD